MTKNSRMTDEQIRALIRRRQEERDRIEKQKRELMDDDERAAWEELEAVILALQRKSKRTIH